MRTIPASLIGVVAFVFSSAAARGDAGNPPGAVKAEKLENHGQTVTWTPAHAFRPGKDIEELSQILKWMHEKLPPGTKVKPGGSRGSWPAIAATDGVYIHPEGMSFVERLPRADLKPAVKTGLLFRAGSGTTLHDINYALWADGAALPVLPGSDMLRLAGMIVTGTHGSVLSQGPLADFVRSIDLVKADGTKVRIEPRDGITDPAAFAHSHAGWQLLQDEDTFDAALINMGTLGVIHSYVIEGREKFWLKEIRSKTTGKAAEALLKNGGIYKLAENARSGHAQVKGFKGHPAPAYYIEMLWAPHSDKLILTTREPVDAKERAKYEKSEPATFKTGPSRQILRQLITDPKYARPLGPALASNAYKVVLWASKQASKLDKDFTVKGVDMALDAMVDKEYTQRSYNVFNYGELVNQVPGQASTITVPIRGDLYLRAIDIMRNTAHEFAKRHIYQSGAISWRFVKASRAILGDPEDVCKFEIIFSGADAAAKKLAAEMSAGYYAAVEKELGADVRFHWGHGIPPTELAKYRAHIPKAFPRYSKFEAIRRAFDPHDQFLSAWQAQLLPR